MFHSKKNKLFESVTPTTSASNNKFVSAALQKKSETSSGNGALKFSETDNEFVNQFNMIGSYRKPRNFSSIEADCEKLWAKNKVLCVLFIFYLRIINRVVQLPDGSKTTQTQKGAELKHEAIMRMIWLHYKSPETFWSNIGIFTSIGSWHDIFTMLSYDLEYHGWDDKVLNWDKFSSLILSGLENENTVHLIKKYLPRIQNNKSCTTLSAQANNIIAKWLCSKVFGSKFDFSVKTGSGSEQSAFYRQYRKLKSSGTAHQWQQFISRREYSKIDFNTIHGRALRMLAKSKTFLDKSGLKKSYEEWIAKPETKNVKFTGFVCELFQDLPKQLSLVTTANAETINKQFKTLIEKGQASSEQSKLIVVRDTSGSMDVNAIGLNMSSGNVAKSMALYFSEFLTGKFTNAWIEFNSDAQMHTWKGHTPLEKWYNDKSSFVGSTNFQSVIHLFCKLKKQGINESDFPEGILCISDGDMNKTQTGLTNVQEALNKLTNAGFSKDYVDNFKIILWNVPNGYYSKGGTNNFETYDTKVPNVFYFSGYSASIISFLTGKIKNAAELVDEALDQEILRAIDTSHI